MDLADCMLEFHADGTHGNVEVVQESETHLDCCLRCDTMIETVKVGLQAENKREMKVFVPLGNESNLRNCIFVGSIRDVQSLHKALFPASYFNVITRAPSSLSANFSRGRTLGKVRVKPMSGEYCSCPSCLNNIVASDAIAD